MDAESAPIREPGTFTMPDDLWDRTQSVSAVIGPLTARTVVGRAAVDAAAAALGVSRRQLSSRGYRSCAEGSRALVGR